MSEKTNAEQGFTDSKDTANRVIDETYILSRQKYIPTKEDQQYNERSWQEDFQHENGNYECICHICGKKFQGHKRRVVCKECANIEVSILKSRYEELLLIEAKYIELDQWYWSRPK